MSVLLCCCVFCCTACPSEKDLCPSDGLRFGGLPPRIGLGELRRGKDPEPSESRPLCFLSSASIIGVANARGPAGETGAVVAPAIVTTRFEA